jgi:hypothetical protein
VKERLATRKIELHLTASARDFLIGKGFDPMYGARPLRRAMERYLEDPLAEELLRGHLTTEGRRSYGRRGPVEVRPVGGRQLSPWKPRHRSLVSNARQRRSDRLRRNRPCSATGASVCHSTACADLSRLSSITLSSALNLGVRWAIWPLQSRSASSSRRCCRKCGGAYPGDSRWTRPAIVCAGSTSTLA